MEHWFSCEDDSSFTELNCLALVQPDSRRRMHWCWSGTNKDRSGDRCCKSLYFKVGTGHVPTELKDDIGERIRSKGHEYGATTGRPRRCGWFDVVPIRYSVRVDGITRLAITKLDVLGGIDPVRICLHYRFKNEIIAELPASLEIYEGCKPVYEELEGWPDSVEWHRVALKGYDALPKQSIAFIERIEELVGVPIGPVSVGPERQDTIVIED